MPHFGFKFHFGWFKGVLQEDGGARGWGESRVKQSGLRIRYKTKNENWNNNKGTVTCVPVVEFECPLQKYHPRMVNLLDPSRSPVIWSCHLDRVRIVRRSVWKWRLGREAPPREGKQLWELTTPYFSVHATAVSVCFDVRQLFSKTCKTHGVCGKLGSD